MSVKAVVFLEDRMHELFIRGIVRKVAEKRGMDVDVNVLGERGGIGRALSELRDFVRDCQHGLSGGFDLLVVVIDANCEGYQKRRTTVNEIVSGSGLETRLAVGAPDPHIEKWYLLDLQAVKTVAPESSINGTPEQKCAKGRYKDLLADAVAGADEMMDGVAAAAEIVEVMSLQQAADNDDSFSAFLDDINRVLTYAKRNR